jgi:hypothetical protein
MKPGTLEARSVTSAFLSPTLLYHPTTQWLLLWMRTGTTVGCYLVRHGMKPSEALRHLREMYQGAAQSLIYPHSPETDEQVRFILKWKEDGLA